MRDHQELVDDPHEENPVRRPPADGLLGLQQTVGNHAVTHLVQRMKRQRNAYDPDGPYPPFPTDPSGRPAPGWPTPVPGPTSSPTPGPTPWPTPGPTPSSTPGPMPWPTSSPTSGPPPKRPKVAQESGTTTTTTTAAPVPPKPSAPANLFGDAAPALPPLVEPELKRPRTFEPWLAPKAPSLVYLDGAEKRREVAAAIRKQRVEPRTLAVLLEATRTRKSDKKDATLYQCPACTEYDRKTGFSADHVEPWAELMASDFAGYETPRTANDIRRIYNDLDNLRAVHLRCNSKRGANRKSDADITAEMAPERRIGTLIPARAVKELASTMTNAQLALAYQYMLAIKAGVITDEPTTPTTADDDATTTT